jgi:hypothetical protein
MEAIEKVLAIELGITDVTTVGMVESAAPNCEVAPAPERERAAFAAFLRTRLGAHLSES